MAYSPQLSSLMSSEELNDLSGSGAMSISIFLVNSSDGTIEGCQVITSTEEFHCEFVSCIKGKLKSAYSLVEDQINLQTAYEMFPTSQDLAIASPVKFKIVNS